MRMMVAFEKGAAIRFIGHLDLMRTMQRALRRSGLPLAFSKGFNPHIRLSFAVPLSVGVVGENELMDVPLSSDVEPQDFMDRMNAVLPAAIRIHSCTPIAEDAPSFMSRVAGADYRIEFDQTESGKVLFDRFAEFSAQESCVALRRTKSGENNCDIFQFVTGSSIEQKDQQYVVTLHTLSNQGGMLKPSVWFEALQDYCGISDVPYCAYRTHIMAKAPDGSLRPMEELA